ncbi:hypothetical protein DPMN_099877 [Dreissena polymorpha]|uniref:Uncharacterized protein n=1 Tax=Dreissena polymorpha TaxID=45954 RepID=A0A9D4LFR6_DREPO|nr:hypothetical protein DPMN_099877 [Dreissena polymorpha]
MQYTSRRKKLDKITFHIHQGKTCPANIALVRLESPLLKDAREGASATDAGFRSGTVRVLVGINVNQLVDYAHTINTACIVESVCNKACCTTLYHLELILVSSIQYSTLERPTLVTRSTLHFCGRKSIPQCIQVRLEKLTIKVSFDSQ